MALADLMPIRIGALRRQPRAPKHRAIDEVERLQHQMGGARLLIKGLHLQLDDLHRKHAETIARIDELHGETVRGLEAQLAELERRLHVGVLAEHVVAKTQELSLDEIRKHCVKPLHQAPFATVDPGRVPSWAVTDEPAAT